MRVLAFLFTSVAVVAGQQPQHGGERPHPHHQRSAAEWVEILEDEDRAEWQKPEEVVAALELEQGDDVADIGAGSGYFAMRFARDVAPSGQVYAVDIQQDLIDYLTTARDQKDLPNLMPVLGTPDDPRLEPNSVDLIFICDVVHHIEDRQPYYAKLAKALRPDGRLAIIDFYKRETPMGPSVESRIAREDMIAELEEAGFALEQTFGFLPHQYFLVFDRAER